MSDEKIHGYISCVKESLSSADVLTWFVKNLSNSVWVRYRIEEGIWWHAQELPEKVLITNDNCQRLLIVNLCEAEATLIDLRFPGALKRKTLIQLIQIPEEMGRELFAK